jgi:hypothetical protein
VFQYLVLCKGKIGQIYLFVMSASILFVATWATLYSFAYLRFHDVRAAIDYLGARAVSIKPNIATCTYSIPDEERTLTFSLVNTSEEDLIVYGLESFCSFREGCIVGLDAYPLSLPPGQSKDIRVLYKTPKAIESVPFDVRPVLYTNFGDYHLCVRVAWGTGIAVDRTRESQ